MSNRLNILRRIWGKTKTQDENSSELQSKNKDYFQITFDNHQNPEASFNFDLNNQKNVYYTEASGDNNTPFYEDETEIIMEPKQKHKRRANIKESNYDNRHLQSPKNSIVLSKPTVFMLHNRDAYVYRVESEFYGDSEKPDLEFVIYIPIDTAVNWFKHNADNATHSNTMQENPERALTKAPSKGILYGVEEDDHKYHKASVREKENESKFFDSTDEDEPNNEKERNPEKIKEKKVKGVKKNKKKARRIITTYEEDEDSISLGPLRPRTEKKPVQIVETRKI